MFRILSLALLIALPALSPGGGGARADTWGIEFDNDRVIRTDRHFTHGTRVFWLGDTGEAPAWAYRLVDNLPGLGGPGALRIGITGGQDIFTPDDISASDIIADDRPYAGWLYGGLSVARTHEGNRRAWELDLGIVGPASLARQIQILVHEAVETRDPRGWANQLRNEPGIVLNYEEMWQRAWALGSGSTKFAVTPHIAGSLGNIYTYAAAGAALRVGDFADDDFGPARIRPGVPGTDVAAGADRFQWSLFAGVEGRFVARNIFLDGNSFTDSHRVDRRPLVADLQVGASIALWDTRLTVIPFGLVIVAVIVAFLFGANAADAGIVVHAYIFAAAAIAAAFALIWRNSAAPVAVAVAAAPGGADDVAYNDTIVRYALVATVFWGVTGFTVGLVIALQLVWPDLNFDTSFTNFGRLRPLHTSAVIFAFGGNALIMSSFWVVQRTCRARLAGDLAPWFVFWGYQLFIVLAATGYLLGITQSKEYAEPEWYVDLWLTIVWVVYLLVFLATLWKRREPHIYVANWFFLAFIVTVAMLHIVNGLAVPVSFTGAKSYSLFSGVQDALTQWWYAHNAVGFFLTAGFLGIMYYFMPKQIGRPIYSYRLSIVHFWSLIFLYIWAGPHHLHYTALPDWAQTLGMTFSIMLWMPSWGGMINGLMTLSGVWDKIRTDPIIRFMVISLAFYGMSTFEGPLMSIRSVNSLSHYTDWTIGHVHSGALGWVGYISFAAIYYLAPRVWGRRQLYSLRLVNVHFWVSSIGIVLYICAMWVSGILQGLMWRAYDGLGFLEYSFVETVEAMHPFYAIRALGGLLFVLGGLVMAYNVWRTARGEVREEAPMAGTAAAATA